MQAASGVSNPFGGRGTEIKHNTAGGSGSSPGSPAKGLAIIIHRSVRISVLI